LKIQASKGFLFWVDQEEAIFIFFIFFVVQVLFKTKRTGQIISVHMPSKGIFKISILFLCKYIQ